MKKSLIALAVLAAAGAASAQSSVTLYGIADAYVGSVKNTIASTKINPSQTVVNTGGLSSSRWGLRGTEDLGNGLKANFLVEGQFSTDSGAASGDLFGRKSVVGLSGNFGTVELGRNYTALFSLRAATNHSADSNLAVSGDVWGAGGDFDLRVSNSVRYDSPVFNGFSGAVSYGFAENKTTTIDSTDNVALHVKYANGPVLVGYAYQVQQAATGDDTTFNVIGGSYDFGVAKLVGTYQTVKRAQTAVIGGEDKEYQVGVDVPLGAFTVYAGYANSKNEFKDGTTAEERSGYNLTATYAVSKRTTAYAGYKNVEVDAAVKDSTQVKGNEINQFSIGVRHAF